GGRGGCAGAVRRACGWRRVRIGAGPAAPREIESASSGSETTAMTRSRPLSLTAVPSASWSVTPLPRGGRPRLGFGASGIGRTWPVVRSGLARTTLQIPSDIDPFPRRPKRSGSTRRRFPYETPRRDAGTLRPGTLHYRAHRPEWAIGGVPKSGWEIFLQRGSEEPEVPDHGEADQLARVGEVE